MPENMRIHVCMKFEDEEKYDIKCTLLKDSTVYLFKKFFITKIKSVQLCHIALNVTKLCGSADRRKTFLGNKLSD